MSIITIVQADDWAGAFIDNDIVCEGHSISLYDLAAAVRERGPISEIVFAGSDPDEDDLLKHGCFPEHFSDIVWV